MKIVVEPIAMFQYLISILFGIYPSSTDKYVLELTQGFRLPTGTRSYPRTRHRSATSPRGNSTGQEIVLK